MQNKRYVKINTSNAISISIPPFAYSYFTSTTVSLILNNKYKFFIKFRLITIHYERYP